LEWHEAPTPDGAFVRLPVPGLVVILNVATCGAWRPDPRAAWRAQPAASVRGLALRPSHGRDSATGALGYVSVVLAPWAAELYLGTPASAFAGTIEDLALVDRRWSALLERVAGARSAEERLAVVGAAFRERLSAHGADAPASPARRLAGLLERGEPVAAVAARLGVTPRRLHQRAVETFGVAPSALAQLARFGRGIEALQPGGGGRALADWRGEHADQSHAARAFRQLAGVAPGRYAALRGLTARTQFCLQAPATP
jgi:AraC-like DNA-binding protein